MNKYEKLNCLLELCKDFGWKPNDYLYTRNHTIRRKLEGNWVLAQKFLCKDEPYIYIKEYDSGVFDFSDNPDVDEYEVYIRFDSNMGTLYFPIVNHTISLNDCVGFSAANWKTNISYIHNKESFESILQQCEENFAQMNKYIKEYQMKVREKNLKKDF